MVKHGKLIFEYNRINSNIFIGTNQCCQTHFNSELLKKGVHADLSLEKNKIDRPQGVDYYLWIPIEDHTAPTPDQLIIGSQFITNLIKNKIKVYVHCERGHERAPTMVAAYLISTGMTVKQAIDFIKKKRPTSHMGKIQQNALKKFHKKITSN